MRIAAAMISSFVSAELPPAHVAANGAHVSGGGYGQARGFDRAIDKDVAETTASSAAAQPR
jgi:hypothetical protein